MNKSHWIWTAIVAVSLLALSGCAREAEEDLGEAAQNVEDAWEAEKAAAVAELREVEQAAAADIAAIRARAIELEERGEELAAKTWHAMADRLEAAREEAAREIAALENAAADTWRAARDSARRAIGNLEETWKRETALAAAEMRKIVDAASEDLAAIRDRAVELEQAGEEAAAKAWHRMAERVEAAQDAAVKEVEALEAAAARGLRATGEAAASVFYVALGATALAVDKVWELGTHAAAFAAELKDDFVAGARAAWHKTGEELELAREKLAAAEEAAEEAVAAEWHEIVTDLENAREYAAERLGRIEDAAADAWHEEKHGFVEAYHDLRDASERAAARLAEG